MFLCFYANSQTFVCAHRGDAKNAPENTIPAIKSAVEKGVHMIEFDVRMTKDGHLVLMHDETVDRTTNGKGKVSELTSHEIYSLDAGSWFNESFRGTKVPSMAEVFSVIPYGILCNVHVYGDSFVTKVVTKTLKELGETGRCFIACNTEDQLEAIRTEYPDMKVCILPKPGEKRREYIERAIKLNSDYIQINFIQGIDNLKEDIDFAHQKGLKVNFFSAQDRNTIEKLARAKVDYILTDDVDLCMEVLKMFGTEPLKIDFKEEREEIKKQIISLHRFSTIINIMLN
ncbi:MAG: glycerophosphodiester phosphodiesterase family protein [Candidatus Hydrogenedentes bacterium]|nr:glycerophosphodiester phosphodiesterase family protein [Candidatus Hydrogenedentota bacterium]